MVSGKTKITVVGAGEIGSTILYTLMMKKLADELVLFNRNKMRAEAKAADVYHCTGLEGGPAVYSGNMADTAGSDIVIITAGVLPEETGSRTDVLSKNIAIYKKVIPDIVKHSPSCILIVLTNPVDIMAYTAMKLSGIDPSRVIGTGTLIDTMRLKRILSDRTGIRPDKIDAMVIGEHGDSLIPIWGRSSGLDKEYRAEIEESTRRAGWSIRLAKEHSCFAISAAAVRVVEALLGLADGILPVSVYLKGQFGINGIYMGLPALLGSKGVMKVIEPNLSPEEAFRFKASAENLCGFFAQADRYIYGNEKETENEI